MSAKLLFLSKRRPQQRCLLQRPYGRFHHVPMALAAMGHEVHVSLISHAGDDAFVQNRAGVHLQGVDLRRPGPASAWRNLNQQVEQLKPDWIVACSDAWVGVLGARLAKRHGRRLCIDAYDNYEAYMPWNWPLHWAWRHSIRAADVCTAAGPQLAALMDASRPGKTPTAIVPMAADPEFYPRRRSDCRQRLGLPMTAPLLGYFGGWAEGRGTQYLPAIFQRVRAVCPDACLVLSGRPPAAVVNQPGVIALGYVEDAVMPELLSAVNVAAVLTAASSFGLYSYPSKLCEALAAGTPLVATATPPVQWMLRATTAPHCLVAVADVEAFAQAVIGMMTLPQAMTVSLPSWAEAAKALAAILDL